MAECRQALRDRFTRILTAIMTALDGIELVEATHIAFAADAAVFSKTEINVGIIPTFGGTQRLPRNVGRKAGTELILSGRTCTVNLSEWGRDGAQ